MQEIIGKGNTAELFQYEGGIIYEYIQGKTLLSVCVIKSSREKSSRHYHQ